MLDESPLIIFFLYIGIECFSLLSLMDISNGGGSDEEQWSKNGGFLACVSCTTFNILAPIYKRLSDKNCENGYPELWLLRNDSILDRLLELKSSIICLQEFWVGNEELVRMYEKRLGDASYKTYILARTNSRGDGLLTAVHQNCFNVLNYKECLFNGIGDRVAQLLYVELLIPPADQYSEMRRNALVVNTHLIFPHDSRYCFVRLQQVYKILQFIESYCHEHKLPAVPIILCGDWNGSMKGNVCKFLLSQGFVSTYDMAHHSVDTSGGPCKWVSHRNHRGNICAVDFVWLLNPNVNRKPLKRSFMEALLGNVYNLPSRVSTEGAYPLPSPKTDGSYITYSQFFEALAEIGLIGPPYNVFSLEEIRDFWEHMDTSGDGAIDISHFSREWDPRTLLQQKKEIEQIGTQSKPTVNTLVDGSTLGFNVKKAMLSPVEVERGIWPENYSLSDHAQLTVEFSPVQLHGS